ncbi:hypothetical protein ILUMI_16428 [Ignelater luminosus]|uniref:Transposase n=1 Tax=Ignelater luminosus TaxID=2038154 RepID=A0A8K0CLX3_IGNLU|nr:hypothetical protein ILUMI_16428 [Ignelater luminosus]
MVRRHLSEPEVARIVTLVEEGYTYRAVGDRMGRHRVTTRPDDRAIIRHVRREPFVHSNIVAQNFPNRRQQQPERRQRVRNISSRRVRNRLGETGLRARHPNRVPILLTRHRRARSAYANEHRQWTLRQWGNVLFTDESRFSLHGNDRRPLVWRRPGERFRQNFVRPVAAYNGRSVMVWGGVSQTWKIPLVIIRENLTARRYIN